MVRKLGIRIKDRLLELPVKDKIEEIVVDGVSQIVDEFFVSSNKPEMGSIVYCNLALAFEHTGIYVGRNKIVHLNGNGKIEEVGFNRFVNRLDGANPAISIYCAVDSNNEPISNRLVAERALSLLGTRRDYNLLLDNCHKFTYYCMTGDTLPIVTFNTIEAALKETTMFHGWRVVDWESA